MKKVVLGVFLLLVSSGVAFSQEAERATALIEGDSEVIRLILADIEKNFWSEISDGTLVVEEPAERCNGGSCSPPGTNISLNCPTSGGPICGTGETCQCTCTDAGPSSSWKTKNECVKKTTTPVVPTSN